MTSWLSEAWKTSCLWDSDEDEFHLSYTPSTFSWITCPVYDSWWAVKWTYFNSSTHDRIRVWVAGTRLPGYFNLVPSVLRHQCPSTKCQHRLALTFVRPDTGFSWQFILLCSVLMTTPISSKQLKVIQYTLKRFYCGKDYSWFGTGPLIKDHNSVFNIVIYDCRKIMIVQDY